MGNRRRHVLAHPYQTLMGVFAVWKLFLVAIVIGSGVGGAYDTSAALVVLGSGGDRDQRAPSMTMASKLLTRFASWDAVYFVSIAHRGYRFEQWWAFGSGLPITIRGVIEALAQVGIVTDVDSDSQGLALLETLVGILVATAAHLLSAIVLYRLGLILWPSQPQGALLSLLGAILHIVSPAGIFLSSPYAESPCSLFVFAGYLLYARSCVSAKPLIGDAYLVLAGLSFGLATAFRSNGILNGIPFAWEVVKLLASVASTLSRSGRDRDRDRRTALSAAAVRRLLALGVGGVAVAAGSLVPQFVAYRRFCAGPLDGAAEVLRMPRRPWCEGYPPSIYTFVQAHYWDNGFLRYWTLSNLPLFLLAAPVLAILGVSAVDSFLPAAQGTARYPNKATSENVSTEGLDPGRLQDLVRSAATAQLLLAVLATLNHHVQIISRISSGLPLWYFWLAGKVLRGEAWGRRIVVFMIMYASIQGALFASFLPPA